MAYIESFRSFETYFVETGVFKECKRKLQKEGVAVLVGPPGCGKTTTAIGIMKDPFYIDWIKRKITSWTEFTFVDSDRNSLIYIDNIFDGFMYQHELEKWWDMLNCTFYENISPNENPGIEDNGLISNTGGKIHLLITTKESVLPRAREYNKMKRTPVFKRNRIVDATSLPLGNTEKDNIFDKQLDYAEKILKIPKPLMDPKFRRDMKISEGHVGFPLCAHLYACEKEYRPTGVDFFLYPINYLRKQIKCEIDNDKTNSVKTLLLLLFLRECLLLSGKCEERLDLRDSEKCKQFLQQKFSEDMVKQMEPLFFADLETIAKELSVLIIGNEKDRVYQFKHQIICEAAGFYFCTEWSKAAFQYFPFAAFEKHYFLNPTAELCDCFLARIFEEVNKGNISKAFACTAFKQDSFVERFCELLKSKNVLSFVLVTDIASDYPLPALFWICKYNHMTLSRMLSKLVEEKGDPRSHNFYLARFGECCANDENFLRNSNKNAFTSTDAIKDKVLKYVNHKGISILQLVLKSDRSDCDAALIIQKLVDDYKSPKSVQDTHIELAFSCAATEKRYSRILCILALLRIGKDTIHKFCPKEYSPVQIVLETLMECPYSVSLELEMLIRICLFMIYVVNPKSKAHSHLEARSKCRNTDWKTIEELLSSKSQTQEKMSKLIKRLLKELPETHASERIVDNPGTRLSKSLMNAIAISVHHLRNLRC